MPRWTLWTLAIGALAIIAAFAASTVLTSADRAFERRVEQLHDEGFATTTAELLGPASPDAEAAAAEIQAAWDALATGPGYCDVHDRGNCEDWDGRVHYPWYETDCPEHMHALAAWFAAAWPFFDRVSTAVARPAIRFPRPTDEFGMADTAPVSLVQGVAELLEARARAAPDAADRVAACRDLLRLGRRVDVPSPGWEGGSALERRGLLAVRDGVTSGELDALLVAEHLGGDLDAPLREYSSRLPREMVAGIAEQWGAALRGWQPSTPDGRVMEGANAWGRLRREAERLTLDERAGWSWSSASSVASLELWATIARDAARWPTSADPVPAGVGEEVAFECAMIMGERFRRLTAARALARVALAVKARRDATGSWPTSLDDVADAFGGAVPSDPFGGAPFHYEVGTGGVRLASIGRDASDRPLTEEDRLEFGLVWVFPVPADDGRGGAPK